MFWVIVKWLFVVSVISLIHYRVVAPLVEYRRLKSQGVVFNNTGIPMINDVLGLSDLAKKNPYVGQAVNLIKHTNKLEFHPPMHGIFTPAKILVYIASADYLDDVYINKNRYYTKD
jgi:hypothetical protein